MQEAKINLGKVVRIARKRKRITQDYLAEKVGVQPRTILEIENGRGNPRFENLFVMVRLLDIAPNDIFNYDCGLAQDTEQLFRSCPVLVKRNSAWLQLPPEQCCSRSAMRRNTAKKRFQTKRTAERR